jgi:hypothetical protein
MIHRLERQGKCAPDILFIINHQHAHAESLAQLDANENAGASVSQL